MAPPWKQNRFKAKTKRVDTKEDEALKAEIEKTEKAIEALIALKQDPPEVMLKSLGALKARLNPNKYNARKAIYNGIEYDSTREARFAEALSKAGIVFDYQVNLEIQEKFELHNEKIQDIELRIDFIVNYDWYVDVKGDVQDVFKLKWKMLKHKYRDTRKYFLVRKDDDIDSFIKLVKLKEWKEDTLSL